MRFIKALIKTICDEVDFQLWLAATNRHPEYLDFEEFLQDAKCNQREILLKFKTQCMNDDDWEVAHPSILGDCYEIY